MATNYDLAFTVEGFSDGMKLRDYFAAKAMAQLVGQQLYTEDLPPEEPMDFATRKRYTFTNTALLETSGDVKRMAEISYRIADAMLAAREAK